MGQVAKGDESAFNELYTLWSRRVYSFCCKELKDHHEAEDVTQETFVHLYRAAPSYRAEGKFPGFIFRIASNLITSRYRRFKPVDSLSEMLDEDLKETPKALRYSPEDGVLTRIDLENALKGLPDRQLEALLLHGEGFSYKEGAEILGVTPDAFAQLILRGRRALKKIVGNSASLIKGVVGE